MCFSVNQNATRPTTTVAWKAVRKIKRWGRGKTWTGPMYPSDAFLPGRVIIAERGERNLSPTTLSPTKFDGMDSFEGIYVFTTRQQALEYTRFLGTSHKIAIAKLRVAPRDWLVSAGRGNAEKNGSRTYRKVKVVSVEPI